MKISKWGPVFIWMALVFFLSAQPQFPTPGQRWLDVLLEKTAHFAEFAVLAALVLRAVRLEGIRGWRGLGAAMLVAWVYALSDEFHQHFVPGRVADWSDILFDWLGSVVGAASWLRCCAARSKRKPPDDA